MDDALDARQVNEDVETRPEGVNVVVEESGGGRRIVCGRGEFSVVGLLKSSVFRAGMWAALLGVGFFVAAPHLPDPMGVIRKLSWAFLLVAGGQGAMLMALVVYVSLLWASYEVDGGYLRRSGHWAFFRWRRRWKQEEIAAVRVGERSGDENRHRDVVELLMKDGKRVVVAGGGLLYLRYLATLLRHELGVGAEAEVPALDPTDPRWHLLDESEKPEKFSYDVVEAEGRVVVSRKWKGFSRTEGMLVGSWLVVTTGAAVMVPIFALPHAKNADDVEAIWMISGMAVLLGLFIIGVALYDIVDRWALVATADEISFTRRTLFRRRSKHWLTEELRAVKTDAQFPANPRTAVRVIVMTTRGEEKLMTGKANVYRYLATLLRRVTGLPASVESGAAATAEIAEGRQ